MKFKLQLVVAAAKVLIPQVRASVTRIVTGRPANPVEKIIAEAGTQIVIMGFAKILRRMGYDEPKPAT